MGQGPRNLGFLFVCSLSTGQATDIVAGAILNLVTQDPRFWFHNLKGSLTLKAASQVTIELADMAETTMPLLSAKREPVVGKALEGWTGGISGGAVPGPGCGASAVHYFLAVPR